jgi:hypothetical protein
MLLQGHAQQLDGVGHLRMTHAKATHVQVGT